MKNLIFAVVCLCAVPAFGQGGPPLPGGGSGSAAVWEITSVPGPGFIATTEIPVEGTTGNSAADYKLSLKYRVSTHIIPYYEIEATSDADGTFSKDIPLWPSAETDPSSTEYVVLYEKKLKAGGGHSWNYWDNKPVEVRRAP